MLAKPLKAGSGVKVAVKTLGSLVGTMAPKEPPLTTISPAVPSQAKLATGSSLKVKVMVAVSPALSAALLLVMASVGAAVSTLISCALLALPALPAASV